MHRVLPCLVFIGLSGCAGVNWERAVYEGQRNAAAPCRAAQRPSDPPCAALPDHAQYERERARAKGGAGTDTARPAEAAPR